MRRRLLLAAILGVALAVRLGWVLLVPNGQYSDSVWYEAAAWNLVAHHFYGQTAPSAWFPPGYPFFLAAIYAAAGHSELAGKLGNVALGVVTTGCTYLLARRLMGEAVGLVAAAIVAVWPNLIFSTGILGSDLLAAGGFVVVLWLALRREGSWGWPRVVLLGLLIGWMVLVRPVAVILFGSLGLWWWIRSRSFGTAVLRVAPVVVVAALPVLGWSLRNERTFGQPIAISTNGGYNFWQSNQPYADGNDTYWSVVPMDDPMYQTMRNGDEFTKNSLGYRYGLAFLASHPLQPFELFPAKLFWLYGTDTSGFYEGALYAPMQGPSAVAGWIAAHERLVESATFRYYELLLFLAGAGALAALPMSQRLRRLLPLGWLLGTGVILLAVGALHPLELALVALGAAVLVAAAVRPITSGVPSSQWLWPLLALPLLLPLFHLLFHAKDRFHIPIDAVLAVLAAYALVQLAALARGSVQDAFVAHAPGDLVLVGVGDDGQDVLA